MPVIPPTYYQLDPSANTITFFAPYSTITAPEIQSIRNLSKQIGIYNSDDPRRHTSMLTHPPQPFDISIVGGVLTYVVDAGMDTGDSIQIVIYSKNPSRNTELTGAELTVSTGGTPSAEINDVDTTGAKRIAVQVNNKGASTIVEVTAYCAVGSLAYTTGCIGSFNLDTTNRNDIMFLVADFDKVKVIATNKDTANATTVDIAVKVIDE